MRVLHVIPSIAPEHGGPSRSVPRLVETLRQQGIDVRLAAAGTNGERNVTLKHLQMPGEILTAESKKKLAKAVAESDLVEIHSLWNGTSSSAAAACRRAGVPYVLTPRGMLDPACVSNHSMSKWVYRRLVDRINLTEASGFHFLTTDERDRAVTGRRLTEFQIAVSPNGATEPPSDTPTGLLRKRFPQLTQLEGKRVVLHLGRLDPIKGIDFQIRALALLSEDERPTLLLVGPDFGDEQRLRKVAREQQVEPWVVFGGPVYGEERFALLKEADLVLLTSIYDCNPVVATETFMMGGAMLATEGCGLSDLAKGGAVKVVPYNLEEFATAMGLLLAQPETLLSLRSCAQKSARSLAWPHVISPLIELYERLVSRPAVARQTGRSIG